MVHSLFSSHSQIEENLLRQAQLLLHCATQPLFLYLYFPFTAKTAFPLLRLGFYVQHSRSQKNITKFLVAKITLCIRVIKNISIAHFAMYSFGFAFYYLFYIFKNAFLLSAYLLG